MLMINPESLTGISVLTRLYSFALSWLMFRNSCIVQAVGLMREYSSSFLVRSLFMMLEKADRFTMWIGMILLCCNCSRVKTLNISEMWRSVLYEEYFLINAILTRKISQSSFRHSSKFQPWVHNLQSCCQRRDNSTKTNKFRHLDVSFKNYCFSLELLVMKNT